MEYSVCWPILIEYLELEFAMQSLRVTGVDELRSALRPQRGLAILRDRRQSVRHTTSQQAEICLAASDNVFELVDLSDQGAKLRIISGLVPSLSSPIFIRLLDRTEIIGITRWIGKQDIGVKFMPSAFNADDHIFYDDLGQQHFALILQRQRRLVAARGRFASV
jgi:hypothetical protein